MKTSQLKRPIKGKASFMLAALPLVLAGACYATYPFPDEITHKTISTSALSSVQRANIMLAADAVNDYVIKPGCEFSFNNVVGERSTARGYRPAPSYLGPESPATVGGGVCLMSSALYQAALESGCEIKQRYPHLRTIKSVPAGLDATVWFGQADLRFKNTLKAAIQIHTVMSDQSLQVSFLGRRDPTALPIRLERIVRSATKDDIVVELLRKQGDRVALVSRDHYQISR